MSTELMDAAAPSFPRNRGHRENRAKEEENRLESNCGGGGDAEGEARIDSCLLRCTLEESLTSD